MSLSQDISLGLQGAWRLLRRDPGGMDLIDPTIRGFWRSFWAAAIVAPAFIALDVLLGRLDDFGPRQAIVHMIGYVIDWTAFPVAMLSVVDGLGKRPLYCRYIAVYNWSAVVQMSILLPVALLAVAIPGHATLLLAQAATIILLVYRAYLAHIALSVGLGSAAAIVLLDVLLAAAGKLATELLLGGATG